MLSDSQDQPGVSGSTAPAPAEPDTITLRVDDVIEADTGTALGAAPRPAPPRGPPPRRGEPRPMRELLDEAERTPHQWLAHLQPELAHALPRDHREAAILAYEVGVWAEAAGDMPLAAAEYGRSFLIAPDFEASGVALRRVLYRLARWPELLDHLDVELSRAESDALRAPWWFERAIVCGNLERFEDARIALREVLRLTPANRDAMLEEGRVVARLDDRGHYATICEQLARSSVDPERKVALYLEAARVNDLPRRAVQALANATKVVLGAEPSPTLAALGLRVVRARLRWASDGPIELSLDALEGLEPLLLDESSSEPAPPQRADRQLHAKLLRDYVRLVQPVRPELALRFAKHAAELFPENALALAEAMTQAATTGHVAELAELTRRWAAIGDLEREALVSGWCGDLIEDPPPERSTAIRALLDAVSATMPGNPMLLAATELDTLVSEPDSQRRHALATSYFHAAQAPGQGGPQPGPQAAATLLIQAAYVLSLDDTLVADGRARDALVAALALVPGHRIACELMLELDARAGDTEACVALLRRLAIEDSQPAHFERAIAIALLHGRIDTMLELAEERWTPELSATWRLDSLRADLGRHAERVELLASLARTAAAPRDRTSALRKLATIWLRLGAAAPPELARHLTEINVDDELLRDVRNSLLRDQERWVELASERRVEGYIAVDDAAARRAWREAAWVLELRFDDLAQAATVYSEWRSRMPEDRMAIEGLARCRAATGNFVEEAEARAAILALDDSDEQRWLLARSLERAGRADEARLQYQQVSRSDASPLAATTATLAMLQLAMRANDLGGVAEALEALGRMTTQRDLIATLHDRAGWSHLLGTDHEGARRAFAAAAAQDPVLPSALLGAVLVGGIEDAPAGATLAALGAALSTSLGGDLLVRAAVSAFGDGDPALGRALLDEACARWPDHANARFLAASFWRDPREERDDPFAVDELGAHADVVAWRGELADDEPSRMDWMLERAAALEAAGRLHEAMDVLAAVVRAAPDRLGGHAAIRRLAGATKDASIRARATHQLARVLCDPASRLRLLHEAERLYGEPGAQVDDHALRALYRDLADLDPTASERWLPRIPKHAHRDRLDALGDIAQRNPNATAAVAALLARAQQLLVLGLRAPAEADLAAIRERGPDQLQMPPLEDELPDAATTTRVPAVPTTPDALDRSTVRSDTRDLEEAERAEARRAGLRPPTAPERFTGETTITKLARPHASDALTVPALDLDKLLGPDQRPPADLGFDVDAIVFPSAISMTGDDSDLVMMSYDALRRKPPDNETAELRALFLAEVGQRGATALDARLELARLAEATGELAAARGHYEAVLADAPADVRALRGAWRHALLSGDLAAVAHYLEREIAVAGERARPYLRRLRAYAFLAAGDQAEGARLLALAPADAMGPFVALELAARDGARADLAQVCERFAIACDEPALVPCFRWLAGLRALGREPRLAATHFAAAATAEPESISARVMALCAALRGNARAEIAAQLLELALQIEADDPHVATALAVMAQDAAGGDPLGEETLETAVLLALRTAPRDALVARIAAETALSGGKRAAAARAFARWARCKCDPIERAAAAARAAELDPVKLGRLWTHVLELHPDDDYAAAHLLAYYRRTSDVRAAIDLDLSIARDSRRELPWLRAAMSVPDQNTDLVIQTLRDGLAQHPTSFALMEALAEALTATEQWGEIARLRSRFRPEGELGDCWRTALACDRAVRATDDEAVERDAADEALLAWDRVLATDPRSVVALTAKRAIEGRLGNVALLAKTLGVAVSSTPVPVEKLTRALELAWLLGRGHAAHSLANLRGVAPELDDPRRAIAMMLLRAGQPAEIANVLDARATLLEASGTTSTEPDVLRFRAAFFSGRAGDLDRTRALLASASRSLPVPCADLDRRLPGPASRHPSPFLEAYARSVLDAERAAVRGETAVAIVLYRQLRRSHRTDPTVNDPLLHLLRTSDASRARAFADEVRADAERSSAEDGSGARPVRTALYELLERVQGELCGDQPKAVDALMDAWRASPRRLDLAIRLDHELASRGDHAGELEVILASSTEASALDFTTTILAERAQRPRADLVGLYRRVLAGEPGHRLALAHLDRLLGPSASTELATIVMQLSTTLDQAPSRAASLTRAGQALADAGAVDAGMQLFASALDAMPAFRPALDAWFTVALAHQRWAQLVDVATRLAPLERTTVRIAARFHLAGAVYAELLTRPDLAITAFTRALAAEPQHVDSFVRLRRLLAAARRNAELEALLQARLVSERTPSSQAELLRAIAQQRELRGEPEAALELYRASLKLEPNEAARHAVADLAGGDGGWPAAAARIVARLPLETDHEILRWSWCRLGALYATHAPHRAVDAFARALTFAPEDRATLSYLLDAAIAVGDLRRALVTCETLAALEHAPDRRGELFYRAAALLAELGERQRASEMIAKAVDLIPARESGFRSMLALYRGDIDPPGFRRNLVRLANNVRTHVASTPTDGEAYRVLSDAIAIRDGDRSGLIPVGAQIAAELASLLEPAGTKLSQAGAWRPDEVRRPRWPNETALFAAARAPVARRLFAACAPALEKLLGSVQATFGVGRKDRLGVQHAAYATVQDVAAGLGVDVTDVYLTSRAPYAMHADSLGGRHTLVLGAAHLTDATAVRFAAGGALALAQLDLAVPARLGNELERWGLLLWRILLQATRSNEPRDPAFDRLAKAIPPRLLDELRGEVRPDESFGASEFALDLKIASFRGGLAAACSIHPAIAARRATQGLDLQQVLLDPVIQGVLHYAFE